MTFELTPIEKRGDYFFKREDLFAPFSFCGVNGSKLRQCMQLVDKFPDQAANGLITATSILSPQAVIVAAVAKSKGVPCTIMYGGTTVERLAKLDYPRLCFQLGADVKIVAATGRTSAITAQAAELARRTGRQLIRYGFDMRGNIDCFLGSVAEQVQNIPERLDNIVVTCGSAITLVGILFGLSLYGKKVANVYAIGVAPNREAKIKEYARLIAESGHKSDITAPLRYIDAFRFYKGFKYENRVTSYYHGITFHPRYEAKAFRWLQNTRLHGDTLFWITGSEILK